MLNAFDGTTLDNFSAPLSSLSFFIKCYQEFSVIIFGVNGYCFFF